MILFRFLYLPQITTLKILLTVYFSILFLILLYDQFYYEKCHYLALIGGGRLGGGEALRSVNILRKVWFPLALPHQYSQPCPPPPPPMISTLPSPLPPPPIMQNLPTPMIKSHEAACSCKVWIVKQDLYVHDHTAYIHTYMCRYYRRKQHTLRNQP